MKKAMRNARSKRNWARVLGLGAIFTVCLLNLQVGFKDAKTGDVSLASLSVTSQQVSAQTTPHMRYYTSLWGCISTGGSCLPDVEVTQ